MVISNLPVLLAERRLTITKVFKDTGISRTTLTALVNGSAVGVHFDTVNTLCRYLQVNPGQLFLFTPFEIQVMKCGAVVPGSVSFTSETAVSFRDTDSFRVLEEWASYGDDRDMSTGAMFELDASISAMYDVSSRVLHADVAFSLPGKEGDALFLETFSRLPRPFISQIERDFALTHSGLSDPLRKIREPGEPKKGDIIPPGVDIDEWINEKVKCKVAYNITWPKELAYQNR